MANHRILIVEDDMDVAELLVMFFSGQGYETFHADTGVGGIALARAKLPNLILLDIMLPDMEGFTVCHELRSTNLTKYIPTIFLTQRNAHRDKVSGLELGADDYITKPFDVEELRIRVQRSIQRATRDHLHEEVTGLPTGPLIEEEFERFRRSKGEKHRLDVHIIGFDDFRDVYGFLTANDARGLAARILSDTVVSLGTHNDFVGVVESAYFVIFTYSPNYLQIVETASREFAERAAALYKFTDIDKGYALIDAGLPTARRIPLMRFEVAVHDAVVPSN